MSEPHASHASGSGYIPAPPKRRTNTTEFRVPANVNYRNLWLTVGAVCVACSAMVLGPHYYRQANQVQGHDGGYLQYKKRAREARLQNMREDEMPER